MKKFNIEVISKKSEKIDGVLSHTGKITIGDLQENFVMPLNYWTIDTYQQQWKDAIQRIKTHDYSCFVVSVRDWDGDLEIEIWSMYKEGDMVFFHNEFLDAEDSNFNLKTCYNFGDSLEQEKEDRDKVSTWSLNIKDI